MKKLTYKILSDHIKNEAVNHPDGQAVVDMLSCGTNFQIIIIGLANAVNESIKEDAKTGYDWEDPSIDPIAAVHQIQELLDEKL